MRYIAILILTVSFQSYSAEMNYGHFEGKVKAEWLTGDESERRMKLLEDFTYVDPKGKRWTAPKGYVTDGASIPKVFWSIIGAPFDGQYREAAVIHDEYCDSKTEPWKDVHRIFYYANRAAGVSEIKAKILYTAVRVAGPKWGDNSSHCYTCHTIQNKNYQTDKNGRLTNIPQISETEAKEVAKWVTEKNPSLEDIDQYIGGKFPKSGFGHDELGY